MVPTHGYNETIATPNCKATNPTHQGENNTLEGLAVEEDMEKVHRLRAALVIDVQILQRPQAQVVRRLMRHPKISRNQASSQPRKGC